MNKATNAPKGSARRAVEEGAHDVVAETGELGGDGR
jgi:hypothetical protein